MTGELSLSNLGMGKRRETPFNFMDRTRESRKLPNRSTQRIEVDQSFEVGSPNYARRQRHLTAFDGGSYSIVFDHGGRGQMTEMEKSIQRVERTSNLGSMNYQ